MDIRRKAINEMLAVVEKGDLNPKKLSLLKLKIARKYHLAKVPSNIELSNSASKSTRKKFENLLSIKPVRTLSGVAPVAIMCPPHNCPHGKCVYCPGGLSSYFGDVPQSYTGKEPATRRAIRNDYDPYLQVMNRLEQYAVMNKVTDKIEIIVMGGTFLSLPKNIRDEFTALIYRALNDFGRLFYHGGRLNYKKFNAFFELHLNRDDEKRIDRINARLKKIKPNKLDLEKEKTKNEDAKVRCIGLVVETRPDICKEQHIHDLLQMGATKVELGVQTVYDDILKAVKRGHNVKDTIDATRLLKDSGFKINYHIMPGLPGMNMKKDLQAFRTLFVNPHFRPDMLKIYPCMVMRGTHLYNLYKKGKYKPITTAKAIKLIAKFKTLVPEYVRIMRVQRDIPTNTTEAGVNRTNLRQYIHEYMKHNDMICRCIRCREAGRKGSIGKVDYLVKEYEASQGKEFFISAYIKKTDALLGFCRLRFISRSFLKEMPQDCAIIRELHVYGTSTGFGQKGAVQHKGIGKHLVSIAEDMAKQNYKKDIVIISGVGVRNYYRKLGYRKSGPYMKKKLK